MALMFGALSFQITKQDQTISNLNFELVQIAYAQDAPAPSAEAKKAAAKAETEDVKKEVLVPELPGSKDDPATDLDTESFLAAAMKALGSWKALGAMGIAALVSQLIMLFLRTPLASFAGKYKLVAIYVLSIVSGLLVLKVSGMTWGAAALHTQTLAALQVFGNQVYKQFIQKADEKPA